MANIFGAETPAVTNANDGTTYTLGTRFVPQVAGQVTHGRKFEPVAALTDYTFVLYRNSDEAVLGTVTYTAEVQGAWFEVAFPSPIPVSAGVEYTIAYFTPGPYVVTSAYFGSGKVSGDLVCPVNAGRFRDQGPGGSSPLFPSDSFNNGAYFADVVFEPTAGPAEGSSDVGLDLAVATAGARDSQGSAQLGVGLAVSATGARAASGTVALGLGLAVAGAGARDSAGAAGVGLNLAVDATGQTEVPSGTVALALNLSPAATGARAAAGTSALGLDLEATATGERDSAGAAAAGFGLAVASSGQRPSASGVVALGLNLAPAAEGSNGSTGRPVTPWPFPSSPVAAYPCTPRPVRSFSEVTP